MNFSVYNGNISPINSAYVNSVSKAYPVVNSRAILRSDFFENGNYLDKLLNKDTVNDMVISNPVIAKILDDKNIKPVVNIDNFNKTIRKHCIDTCNNAAAMYDFLPLDLKTEASLNCIRKGALLHDIGKILIPKEILNKKGKLSPNETEIMQLHSKLGGAMLATQNIEPEVLNIVKYHHQNLQGTGYPAIKNSASGYDINTQIAALADKYTALTEHRAYKTAKSDEEALSILKEEVNKGQINPYIYNALAGCVNNNGTANISKMNVSAGLS